MTTVAVLGAGLMGSGMTAGLDTLGLYRTATADREEQDMAAVVHAFDPIHDASMR